MPIADTPTAEVGRRRFLSRITNGIMTVIGGILAVIGGGAVLSSTANKRDDWTAASSLSMRRVANRCGSTVWSITSTPAPSAAGQIVR